MSFTFKMIALDNTIISRDPLISLKYSAKKMVHMIFLNGSEIGLFACKKLLLLVLVSTISICICNARYDGQNPLTCLVPISNH